MSGMLPANKLPGGGPESSFKRRLRWMALATKWATERAERVASNLKASRREGKSTIVEQRTDCKESSRESKSRTQLVHESRQTLSVTIWHPGCYAVVVLHST